MARLGKSYPFPEPDYSVPFDTLNNRQNEAFDAIPEDRIIRTPVADGYAYYFVDSMKPLVLRHIPYGDAWHASAVWIRGLRAEDVSQMIDRDKRMKELFSGKEIPNER